MHFIFVADFTFLHFPPTLQSHFTFTAHLIHGVAVVASSNLIIVPATHFQFLPHPVQSNLIFQSLNIKTVAFILSVLILLGLKEKCTLCLSFPAHHILSAQFQTIPSACLPRPSSPISLHSSFLWWLTLSFQLSKC
jgi:hypothetical protein